MKIFALSDPHLSRSQDKPMDIFGDQWTDHGRQIAEAWDRLVSPEDLVLVPGDISWAMKLAKALPDLEDLRKEGSFRLEWSMLHQETATNSSADEDPGDGDADGEGHRQPAQRQLLVFFTSPGRLVLMCERS